VLAVLQALAPPLQVLPCCNVCCADRVATPTQVLLRYWSGFVIAGAAVLCCVCC